ncbi:parathyroid hormone-related protein-like [Scleropages formosus]|uniref:Parathyroid hormone like hormone n=1 Tax=Scleropages formosus TaxID=113540 RepID=A0A0N8JWF9_SCLFO|nr:parathyroid hormone-related protein [Scleropages formosus]KPP60825.1 parathyroid hormone-related protein-like [Scleropages formosus]
MFCSRRLLQQWSFAVFLLCSPVPYYGRPIDALTNRMRRSVTHAQLMHDKGRTLQDFKRRMWLQELLDEVHTAEVRELPDRAGGAAGGGVAVISGVLPKPAGSTKNYPVGFRLDEEGTHLPQETNKSQTYKDQSLKAASKKKKKGRTGKRRESEKKRRRARSLPGPRARSSFLLQRQPFFGLLAQLH